MAGGSCDGCSIAAVGASSPSVEDLLRGVIPGVPKVVLHHPVLAVVAGEEFIKPFRLAAKGELGAPFVVICEGSIMDERIAASTGGYWSGLGVDEDGKWRSTTYSLFQLGIAHVQACGSCCGCRHLRYMGRCSSRCRKPPQMRRASWTF